MTLESSDHARITEALAFALAQHDGQTRKGKTVPYVSHLLQVAGLVLEHGGDANQTIAALLHDTVEDCPGVSEALLRERFGDAVADMVIECTDLLEGDSPAKKSSWKARKTAYLTHLASSSGSTQLVAACDKLHNLTNLVTDLRALGPAILERFNATPGQTLWYYTEIEAALGESIPAVLRTEFEQQLAQLRTFVERIPPTR